MNSLSGSLLIILNEIYKKTKLFLFKQIKQSQSSKILFKQIL